MFLMHKKKAATLNSFVLVAEILGRDKTGLPIL